MIASHVVFQFNDCTLGSHSQSKKSKLYLKAEETCFIIPTEHAIPQVTNLEQHNQTARNRV